MKSRSIIFEKKVTCKLPELGIALTLYDKYILSCFQSLLLLEMAPWPSKPWFLNQVSTLKTYLQKWSKIQVCLKSFKNKVK